MSRFSLPRRHDPYWEVDGPTARRARRRERTVSSLAFVVAVTAVAGAAVAWSFELGVAAAAGVLLGLSVS